MNDSTVAYWTSGIAPSPADDRRLPADPSRLVQLVMERSVALRGWNYPHVPRSDAHQGVTGLPDGGIEAVTSTGRYQEVWQIGRAHG